MRPRRPAGRRVRHLRPCGRVEYNSACLGVCAHTRMEIDLCGLQQCLCAGSPEGACLDPPTQRLPIIQARIHLFAAQEESIWAFHRAQTLVRTLERCLAQGWFQAVRVRPMLAFEAKHDHLPLRG